MSATKDPPPVSFKRSDIDEDVVLVDAWSGSSSGGAASSSSSSFGDSDQETYIFPMEGMTPMMFPSCATPGGVDYNAPAKSSTFSGSMTGSRMGVISGPASSSCQSGSSDGDDENEAMFTFPIDRMFPSMFPYHATAGGSDYLPVHSCTLSGSTAGSRMGVVSMPSCQSSNGDENDEDETMFMFPIDRMPPSVFPDYATAGSADFCGGCYGASSSSSRCHPDGAGSIRSSPNDTSSALAMREAVSTAAIFPSAVAGVMHVAMCNTCGTTWAEYTSEALLRTGYNSTPPKQNVTNEYMGCCVKCGPAKMTILREMALSHTNTRVKSIDTCEQARTSDEKLPSSKLYCSGCGIKTQKSRFGVAVPLTNANVFEGHCIACDPSSVPFGVCQKWHQQQWASGNNTVPAIPPSLGSKPGVFWETSHAPEYLLRKIKEISLRAWGSVTPAQNAAHQQLSMPAGIEPVMAPTESSAQVAAPEKHHDESENPDNTLLEAEVTVQRNPATVVQDGSIRTSPLERTRPVGVPIATPISNSDSYIDDDSNVLMASVFQVDMAGLASEIEAVNVVSIKTKTGYCKTCGTVKTHRKLFFSLFLIPLTNQNVLKGKCRHCFPEGAHIQSQHRTTVATQSGVAVSEVAQTTSSLDFAGRWRVRRQRAENRYRWAEPNVPVATQGANRNLDQQMKNRRERTTGTTPIVPSMSPEETWIRAQHKMDLHIVEQLRDPTLRRFKEDAINSGMKKRIRMAKKNS